MCAETKCIKVNKTPPLLEERLFTLGKSLSNLMMSIHRRYHGYHGDAYVTQHKRI